MPSAITKSDIVRAVSELPDDATLDDAFERLFVLHKIERGLHEGEAGETMTQAEVEAHFRRRRGSETQQ
jgi:predicted transcriptional regulator